MSNPNVFPIKHHVVLLLTCIPTGTGLCVSQAGKGGLPGLKKIRLGDNGRFEDRFLRALTGNRRIFGGRVCHKYRVVFGIVECVLPVQ